MSDVFDFNTAEVRGDPTDLIPEGTVATVVAKLRPGAHGQGGWLKASSSGLLMADFEFTVEGGKYNRRKFWANYVVEVPEGATDGQRQAAGISRGMLRSMIESAMGVMPGDSSPEAMAKRKVPGYQAFDGLRFCAKIGVEKGELKPGEVPPNGERYPDKNKLVAAVTPDSRNYVAPGSQENVVPFAGAATAQVQAPAQTAQISKPSWGV